MHITNGYMWLKWPFEVTLRPAMTCPLNSRIFFESSESPVTVSFEYEAEVLLPVDREQVIYIYCKVVF